MRLAAEKLLFFTRRQGLMDITSEVVAWTMQKGMTTGLLSLFCPHTSASLLVQDNDTPELQAQLEDLFARIAPDDGDDPPYGQEPIDSAPAHLRTALTSTQVSIPLISGRLALGAWQGLYLFEHLRRPHHREIAVHLMGE